MMATSRVYILAHFPHQCAFAIMIGYIIFYYTQSKIDNYVNGTTFKKLNVAIFLLGSTIFIHENLQKMVGFGPNWSIDMAKKYCAKVVYLTFNLTKFGSMKAFLFSG